MSPAPEERLEPRLRAAALVILRRHGIAEDELQFDFAKPGAAAACVITGHRIRIHVDDKRADFQARGGRWSGARRDFPSAGALVAALEEALHRALSGGEVS